MNQTNEERSAASRPTVKTWRERIGAGPDFPLHAPNDVERAMEAEIAQLRAELTAATRPAGAPTMLRVSLVPKWVGEFHSYQDWVNNAQSRLDSPNHRRAMCVDAKGRRCAIGADMTRARDEGAFPVRYFWECEPAAATAAAPAEAKSQTIIGKLLDDFSNIQHLWGLGEPGALVRQSDVFNLIIAASKSLEVTALATASVNLRVLISDDTHAATFQSVGQYRSALLKVLAGKDAEQA